MSDFFDDIERDLVAAAGRRPVPRRSRAAALALAGTLALSAGGTAAAAAYYVLRASPIAPFASEDSTPEQAVAPGTSRVLTLRARDPRTGEPPWALRLARSRTGLLCGTVAQVDRGAFGLVGLDGRFRELPEANADACGDDVRGDATLLGLRVFDADEAERARTVLNGVAAGVREVRVATLGARPRRLRHSSEGGFLAAWAGYPEDLQPRVTLRFADGAVRRHAFARDPQVVPDPFGAPAWRLESYTFGVSRPPGRRAPRPRLQTVCVRFSSARSGPGGPAAAAPPVCGKEPARAGVPDRSLYFATRRLAGDGEPGDTLTRGDWNGRPPRTAVYGNARVARSLTVAAPGVRRTVRPTINGAFLVLLSPDVRPSSVRVTARLRTGGVRTFGPTTGTVPAPKP